MAKRTPVDAWAATRLNITGELTQEALQQRQLQEFRKTLQHVLPSSRFYKEHLKGIDPDSIKTIEDLSRLPFTHADMLVERPNDFLCVSPRDISRIFTLSTSGTSGKPKRISFTPEDQELTIDYFHHGMTTLADPHDRVIIFMPGATEGSVGDLLMKAFCRFDCEGILFGPIADYDAAMKALIDSKANCAIGIPSQMLALSRCASDGFTKTIRLKSILLSADYVPRVVAESLTAQWGCAVYGHYGMTEMGFGGGVECYAMNGYHTRDADLLFEIIDPATGKAVQDGEYGEIVFSTLRRKGMPLIRYRTGDASRFLMEPCECGSILKRLERVSGRINDKVQLQHGIFLSIADLDEILYRIPWIAGFSAALTQNNGLDSLLLTIQSARSDFDSQEIVNALSRHHSLGILLQQKELTLDIRSGDPGFFTTGTTKRLLVDRR